MSQRRAVDEMEDENGGPVMTKEWLRAHCKKTNQYVTPALNDKLYLHFKGFGAITNLEEYTGIRALFIEGNGLVSLKGLSAQKELRCLFAQQNCIETISDLESNLALNTLNLSNNRISHISGLAHLPDLQSLQLASNKLETLESLKHLAECPVLSTVDLSSNNLDGPDADAFLEVFQSMPSLQVLYLKGNPIVSKFSHYRKRFIAGIPKLTYLDDRPVFETERRLSQAWVRGGFDEERLERQRMRQEELEREARQMSFMRGIRDAAQARRKAAQEQANGGLTDAEVDAAVAEELAADELEAVGEPEELIRAREALAQYSARPGEEEPKELTETRMQLAAEGRLKATETRPWQPALPEAEETQAETSQASSPGTPPAKAAEERASSFAGDGAASAAAEEEEAPAAALEAADVGEAGQPEHSEFVTGAIADAASLLGGHDAAAGEGADALDTPDTPGDTPDTPEQREMREKWGTDAAAAAAAATTAVAAPAPAAADSSAAYEEDDDSAFLPTASGSLRLDDITLQDDEAPAGAEEVGGSDSSCGGGTTTTMDHNNKEEEEGLVVLTTLPAADEMSEEDEGDLDELD